MPFFDDITCYSGIQLHSEDFHNEHAGINQNDGFKTGNGVQFSNKEYVDTGFYDNVEVINDAEAYDDEVLSAAVSTLDMI